MDQDNPNSGIKFEEDKWRQSAPSFEDEMPKIVRLVIKYSGGAIQNQRQAEYALIGFFILALLISIFFFRRSTVEVKSPTPDIINRVQPAEGFIPR